MRQKTYIRPATETIKEAAIHVLSYSPKDNGSGSGEGDPGDGPAKDYLGGDTDTGDTDITVDDMWNLEW